MKDIKVIDSFLSKEECNILLNEAKNASKWESNGLYNNYKSNNHDLMRTIKYRLDEIFNNEYHIQILRMIHKTDINSKWLYHSDDEGGNDIKYGVVIYLNDDFEGGFTIYRDLGYQVIPKAGTLVIHPANKNFIHSVSEVFSGERYTVTTFAREKR
jgi:hypothetical protein